MPKANPPKLPLCAKDLENLRASGLTDDIIRANGLYTEYDSAKLAAILNRGAGSNCCLGGLVFPYRNLEGTVNCFARVRPHMPRVRDGQPIKYEHPVGESLRAYYPIASLATLRDGQSAIYITEGEKKALALSQLGLAAVGIGGVWCGCKKGTEELIEDLAVISWPGREVYICFDYDQKPKTRQDVEAARNRLAKALKAAGAAEVYKVELPPGPDGAKQGVDDFLVLNGAEAFQQLVEDAISIIKIIPGAWDGSKTNPVIKIIPPTLGEAAYHGPIGQFLRAVAPYSEATDAGVLAHLLPAISTYIGPGPHVSAGNKQPTRVNTILAGPTSTGRKGTSLAPVDLLMELVDRDFWRNQRVGGLSTGEGLIAKVADKKRVNEDGEEEIIPVEKRLYVVEEEFSKILAQLRRDGNILSQIARESYDSGNLSVLTRNNPLQAFGAHICITGHITPEELHDRFNHIEMANGFGNRFLWFAVKSDKILPRCQPMPDKVFQRLARIIQKVGNCPAKHVPLADASMAAWAETIYPSLREDQPGLTGALVARGSSMVLRLALLYFLLDPPPKGVSQGISLEHLEAALAVWKYCEESVQMLFKSRAGTFLGDKVLMLLEAGPLSKDQLNNHLSPKQKEEAPHVLLQLETAGLIRKAILKKTSAGRPATVWELVR